MQNDSLGYDDLIKIILDFDVLDRNGLTIDDYFEDIYKVRVGDNRNAVAHHLEHGVCTTEDTTYHAMVLAHADTSMNLIRDIPVQDNGVRDWREIHDLLSSWREVLLDYCSQEVDSSDIEIAPNNESGNHAASDLVVLHGGQVEMLLETKFGAKTDINSGVRAVSELIGSEAFNPPKEDKDFLISCYEEDPSLAFEQLEVLMMDHVIEYNSRSHYIDPALVYRMVYSSGAKDIDLPDSPYDIVVFHNDRRGGEN